MLPILEDYWERLQALHADIGRTIEGLPQAALDWAPGPEMNSLAVLAVHVGGAERYWIGDVVGGDPSGRDRAAEFHAQGLDAAALRAHLAAALAHSQAVLEKLSLANLETTVVSPRDGREFTVAWCLAHALEHTALHLGHMQITHQLWEQRQGGGKRWDVGAAGAVVHEGKVLLVRSTYGDSKGRWLLPGGYATHQETLDQTAVREVREETGTEAEVVDIIGLRTRYTERGGAVFVLFRMRPLSGQPLPDGVEVDQAAYFSAEEVAAMGDDEVLALSRHAVLAALGGGRGLAENERFPLKDETYRAFLLEHAAEQTGD